MYEGMYSNEMTNEHHFQSLKLLRAATAIQTHQFNKIIANQLIIYPSFGHAITVKKKFQNS